MIFGGGSTTLLSSNRSCSERSSRAVVIPAASAIVEEGRRKGGLESTCRRGLGLNKLVSGVTKLVLLVHTGTAKAEGRGVFFFLNIDFMIYSVRKA